jgi:hypothetical protein
MGLLKKNSLIAQKTNMDLMQTQTLAKIKEIIALKVNFWHLNLVLNKNGHF